MKDFRRVFLLIVLVFGGLALFVYIGFVIGNLLLALLEIVVVTAIIVVVIINFDRWFGAPHGKTRDS